MSLKDFSKKVRLHDEKIRSVLDRPPHIMGHTYTTHAVEYRTTKGDDRIVETTVLEDGRVRHRKYDIATGELITEWVEQAARLVPIPEDQKLPGEVKPESPLVWLRRRVKETCEHAFKEVA